MTFQTQSAIDALEIDVSSSDADLDRTARGLWVGTSGDVSLVTLAGNTVTFVGVSGLLMVQTKKVLTSGTTATDIVALF
jgi:hypothetical protein